MLLSHSSPHMHAPPLAPMGRPIYHPHPTHVRSTSVASIAHLISARVTPLPSASPHSKTAPTPRMDESDSRSSGTANHTTHYSEEEDELDEDEDDDDFLAHQTQAQAQTQDESGKRKVKASRGSQSPNGGEKRRRTTRVSNQFTSSASAPGQQPKANPSLGDRPRPPPLKPHGFAAGRQSRRQSGGYSEIPSPVVMGFDYKNVDAEQLKTVSTTNSTLPFRRWTGTAMPFQPLVVPSTPIPRRFTSYLPHRVSNSTHKNQAEAFQVQTTITIKEQQEALIAQRRREAATGEQSEPKQIEFRNWQPPAPGEKIKSMRRPAGPSSHASASHLSVNTGRSEDVMSGIRSAPLGPSLAAQQLGGRPAGMLPPIQGRNGHLPPSSDVRAATVDRPVEAGERPQYFRPSSGRYEVMPHTARPAPIDRRSFTGPAGPQPQQNGHAHAPGHPVSPPRSGHSASAARREFLAPFERLYEVLSSTESLKFVLQDLHHRYEATLATKAKEIGDFKATTHAASTLLNNLQQSTDSLKDMVRYEIARAGNAPAGSAPPPSVPATTGGLSVDERKEFEDMKVRMKKLEEALLSGPKDTTNTPKSNKRKKAGKDAGEDE